MVPQYTSPDDNFIMTFWILIGFIAFGILIGSILIGIGLYADAMKTIRTIDDRGKDLLDHDVADKKAE